MRRYTNMLKEEIPHVEKTSKIFQKKIILKVTQEDCQILIIHIRILE